MRKLTVFNSISLDGYFTSATGDMSWAHRHDPEWLDYTNQNAQHGEAAFVLGRRTYEQMAGWWASPAATAAMPVVAARMNRSAKYVASRTLTSVDWEHATLLQGSLVEAIAGLKATPGPDLLIMGSGTLVGQLTAAGLIDGYTLVLSPTALGGGRSLFDGVQAPTAFALASARPFTNGNVVLTYARAA